MQYEAAIFDLDGTLINSIDDLADSCNEMLIAYDLPVHNVEEYKYFVGNGVAKLVERALPEKQAQDKEFYEKALAKFRAIYNGKVLNKTRAYRYQGYAGQADGKGNTYGGMYQQAYGSG